MPVGARGAGLARRAKPLARWVGGCRRGCVPQAPEADAAGPAGASGHDAGGLSGAHSVASQSREGFAPELKQREEA